MIDAEAHATEPVPPSAPMSNSEQHFPSALRPVHERAAIVQVEPAERHTDGAEERAVVGDAVLHAGLIVPPGAVGDAHAPPLSGKGGGPDEGKQRCQREEADESMTGHDGVTYIVATS